MKKYNFKKFHLTQGKYEEGTLSELSVSEQIKGKKPMDSDEVLVTYERCSVSICGSGKHGFRVTFNKREFKEFSEMVAEANKRLRY